MSDERSSRSAVDALLSAIRTNLSHPSGVYCQGCRMDIDGEGVVADLLDAGYEIALISRDCTCIAVCGDTPEETGGVCKGLRR